VTVPALALAPCWAFPREERWKVEMHSRKGRPVRSEEMKYESRAETRVRNRKPGLRMGLECGSFGCKNAFEYLMLSDVGE